MKPEGDQRAPKRALPLGRFPLVRTFSLDDLERVQATVNSPIKAERFDRRGGFAWEANRVAFDRLGIMSGRYEEGARGYAPSIEGIYSVLIPWRSRSEARQGGRAAGLVPKKSGALLSPGMRGDFVLGVGYESIQISIPETAVQGALAALLGGPLRERLRFQLELDTARGGGEGVLRLVELIVAQLDRDDSVLRSPIIAGHLTQALIHAMLLGQESNYSDLIQGPVRAPEPRYVKQIEAYLEANRERAVTLGELVSLAGVSGRAIHAAFRAHRGYTPMEFLRARRLELAREQLSSPRAETIAQISLACGFQHFGRFSAAYRARFGESPKATLARSR